MKSKLNLLITILSLSAGCSPEVTDAASNAEQPESSSNTIAADDSQPGRLTTEAKIVDVNDIVAAFAATPIFASNGKVTTLSDDPAVLRLVEIAQLVLTKINADLTDNARILVFDEPDLYRVIYQNIEKTGENRVETTILAEKETGQWINAYSGWYMGPPNN